MLEYPAGKTPAGHLLFTADLISRFEKSTPSESVSQLMQTLEKVKTLEQRGSRGLLSWNRPVRTLSSCYKLWAFRPVAGGKRLARPMQRYLLQRKELFIV